VAAIGYTLSSEEHDPLDLVRYAHKAEEAGFGFAVISDHFHPWIDAQGQSPFVWAVLGGVAGATQDLRVGTGVTCPTTRIHPAIIAHAAATAAAMLPGRFFLGVGSGERLNEHILGDHWPEVSVRQQRLEEAIEVIRLLWKGGLQSHYGTHYTVENARLYTLPPEPPPIMIATAGDRATELAARVGDGMVGLVPDPDVISKFEAAGGAGKPRFGQVHVCWAASEEEARRTVLERWPNGALTGNLFIELALPSQFEDACELVDEERAAEGAVCSPDPEAHVAEIRRYIAAGYDHVYVHQIGPQQDGFFDFYEREVLPALKVDEREATAVGTKA
jgi:coenzyme F420-dependent glucose-6-phosphate dehydrogenase